MMHTHDNDNDDDDDDQDDDDNYGGSWWEEPIFKDEGVVVVVGFGPFSSPALLGVFFCSASSLQDGGV
jgi:hypothetical protein